MKMKKNYMMALMIFMVVIMVTLVVQFKHFKFQFYHINSYHGYAYCVESDALTMKDYFGAVNDHYGGAVIEMMNDEEKMKALVFLEDGTKLEHQLTKIAEHTYLLNVLTLEGVRQKPQRLEIRKSDDSVLAKADVQSVLGELYQASSYDYSFLNIFINRAGVFMGQFEAFDKEAVLDQYDSVTVEFCHQDASKSSGYQLLARAKMPVKDFLELEDLGFSPFLSTAHYDPSKSVEVIVTFEKGDKRQAIVMTLEKGVS